MSGQRPDKPSGTGAVFLGGDRLYASCQGHYAAANDNGNRGGVPP